jgi:hypothetical protein
MHRCGQIIFNARSRGMSCALAQNFAYWFQSTLTRDEFIHYAVCPIPWPFGRETLYIEEPSLTIESRLCLVQPSAMPRIQPGSLLLSIPYIAPVVMIQVVCRMAVRCVLHSRSSTEPLTLLVRVDTSCTHSLHRCHCSSMVNLKQTLAGLCACVVH